MILVSVDPGLRVCGVAVWGYGDEPEGIRLGSAFLARNPEKKARGAKAWAAMASEVSVGVANVLARYAPSFANSVVVECPQAYNPKFQKGDQNDLIELAAVAGAVQGKFYLNPFKGLEAHVSYLPAQWKGQVPKEIHNRRVMESLTEAERNVIDECPPSLLHNVIDGIGIGLFHLQKLGLRK